MKQKSYPSDITDEVQKVGDALNSIFKSDGSNLRTIAKFSSMSVNSVKAVLAGNTANIASYSLVAKALGTTLFDVIKSINPGTLPSTVHTLKASAKEVEVEEEAEEADEVSSNPVDILL